MRFYKMGNYSYDKKRFLRIQRQSLELIIPLAFECAETDDDRETEDPTLTRIDNLDAADGADTSSCRDPELTRRGRGK